MILPQAYYITLALHRNLQDNITARWKSEDICEEVEPYVTKHDIDTVRVLRLLLKRKKISFWCILSLQILTFDGRGVSSHPNHISLLHGATRMLEQIEGG